VYVVKVDFKIFEINVQWHRIFIKTFWKKSLFFKISKTSWYFWKLQT